MSYQLSLKGTAQKEFIDLSAQVRARIAAKLDALEQDPRPAGAEPLAGPLKGLLRIRVGEYRVVYHVDEKQRHITVTRVRHRSKAYG